MNIHSLLLSPKHFTTKEDESLDSIGSDPVLSADLVERYLVVESNRLDSCLDLLEQFAPLYTENEAWLERILPLLATQRTHFNLPLQALRLVEMQLYLMTCYMHLILALQKFDKINSEKKLYETLIEESDSFLLNLDPDQQK